MVGTPKGRFRGQSIRVSPFWAILTLATLITPRSLSGLEVGSVFGPGLEWIGGKDWKNDLSNAGMKESSSSDFLYGIFLRTPLFQWGKVTFQLRPEIQLMTPRGSGSSSSEGIEVFAKVLHFPLLLESWYPLRVGAVYGFVGPSLNLFLTDIEYRIDSTSSIEEGSNTPYYGVVMGALFGVGYAFPITTFSVQLEARYTHTISLVLKDKDTTFGGFYFLLGVYVPLSLD
ncbi:MAG: hypothetical protein N2442_07985 [Spirochaetes bacterium]|nr:hypothetical protein [Spirochaetota bacterium]